MTAKGLWMSPGAKVSIVVLFVLAVAVGIAAYLAAIGYYHREQAAQERQAAQQQAQAEAAERRLCTSLGRLAALKPPPGSSADLSRAYLQSQHQVLAELGPDVGCGTRRKP